MTKHDQNCDLMEAASFGSMGNVCTCNAALKDEFNTLINEPMTVGERYSKEGQAKLDRITELRNLLNLRNGEMQA